MEDCTYADLTTDNRSVRAMKKAVPVHARIATHDGVLKTLEGPMRYRAGDAILTGSRNESWPVQKDVFSKAYVPCTYSETVGSHCKTNLGAFYVKKPVTVYARQMTGPFFVGKENGILQGASGDWLVQYAPDDLAVVSADVFSLYYTVIG